MSTLNLVARSCLAVEIWQEIYSGRRPSLETRLSGGGGARGKREPGFFLFFFQEATIHTK